MALVTGDIGSGKSTALRYASALHPSEYAPSTSPPPRSILELYRQILSALAGTPLAFQSTLTNSSKGNQELVLGKR